MGVNMSENREKELEKLLEKYKKLKITEIIMRWEEEGSKAQSPVLKAHLHAKAVLGQEIMANALEVILQLNKSIKELYNIRSYKYPSYQKALEEIIETIGIFDNDTTASLKQMAEASHEQIDRLSESLIAIQFITLKVVITNMIAIFDANFRVDYKLIKQEVGYAFYEVIGHIPFIGLLTSLKAIIESSLKLIEYYDMAKLFKPQFSDIDKEIKELEKELPLLEIFSSGLEETVTTISKNK